MTRLQIRRRVQGLLRDDSFPVEVLNEALNRVLLDLNGLGRFRFQQNLDTSVVLVSGTYKYNITSTIIAEKLVVYDLGGATTQNSLTKIPDPFDAIENGFFLTSGVPTQYMRWQDQWWLDPIPDATTVGKILSIFHFKDIAEVTSDIVAPGIPTRWHGTLLVYGIAADVQPGLMVRTPAGQVQVAQAYQNAKAEMIRTESWEPYTDKRLIRDGRWTGFENAGHVSKIR